MPNNTLYGAVDTWVGSDAPSTNHVGSTTLRIAKDTALTYIYFNSPIPPGTTVVSALLRVYRKDTWTSSATFTVRRLASQLQASRVTWNNRPGVTGGSATATASAGADGDVLVIDVTDLLQEVANGATWHGFRIESSGTLLRKVYSADGLSRYRPNLYVEWTEAPQAPTNLAPSGGDAVTDAAPMLRFQITDILGDATLAAVQVQIDGDGSFTAPWDSGWYDTTEPQLDLSDSTLAYPGLAYGDVAYWRVRVRDDLALVSDWSDTANFTRLALPALTIDNPAAGTDPFVSEPTPPFIWTFGGTQTAWRVQVYLASDMTTPVLSSGKVYSTENEWTPDAPGLTTTGPYVVEVRAWDDVDRDARSAFAEATRTFVVTPDATVDPVTAISAAQPDPWPSVDLTWTRATAPDSYVIRRDGVVIDALVDPGDVVLVGTTYRYNDPNPRPWHEATWTVQAVVNGKASPLSSPVHFTPRQRGIWLMDVPLGLRVWIAGSDDGTWSRPEEATSYAPLGGTTLVRRVQSRRGYEGTLTGLLIDKYDRTALSYEADLETMRANTNRAVTLIAGDLAIKVHIGNVQTAPTSDVPPGRVVSVDFWQAAT